MVLDDRSQRTVVGCGEDFIVYTSTLTACAAVKCKRAFQRFVFLEEGEAEASFTN